MDRKEEQNQERNRQKEIFAGKVAVVTGASRGFGRAMALELARKGAMVVINYNGSEERAQEVQKCIEEEGNEAAIMQCDVSDFQACEAFFKKVIEQFGRLDILVNCAGIGVVQSVLDHEEDLWDKTLSINLTGTVRFGRAAAKVMKEQGGGKIINMGSQAGVVALDGHLTYGCCKAAVIYATKQFAMELAQYNINVNAISPTIILTPMGEENWYNERGVEFKKKIPAHRFGYPEEVAACAVFLASDASSLVNGANLVIDGGFTIC